MQHIEVVIISVVGRMVNIIWRDGKDELVTRKQWEAIKETHNWTTDF